MVITFTPKSMLASIRIVSPVVADAMAAFNDATSVATYVAPTQYAGMERRAGIKRLNKS